MLLVLKYHAYDLISDLSFLKGEYAILSLTPSQWPMETLDYLQFWLYLGNHHAACKNFVSAQEAYNMALTIPAQGAVSAIQVEAYKKFILVSLLAQGEVPSFNQRLTASATVRYLESLAAPYLDLAKAYRKAAGASASSGGSSSQSVTGEMRHLTEINGEQFLADNNVGLIKQIMKALVKKQITKLTQTYITYSLADIAAHVQLGGDKQQSATAPPQPAPALLAERYVFDMVS